MGQVRQEHAYLTLLAGLRLKVDPILLNVLIVSHVRAYHHDSVTLQFLSHFLHSQLHTVSPLSQHLVHPQQQLCTIIAFFVVQRNKFLYETVFSLVVQKLQYVQINVVKED